ncbi:MAG: 4-(cytidine 5'-diphospho)-2-C-methyl-D-erythritol kinase [Candidatus Aphodosoma sp.]
MVCYPKAKINLGINIVRCRADGYHDIETLFYPIGLSDRLEINEAQKTTSLECDGLTIEGNTDSNLVMRAFRMMQDEFKLPEINIRLHKTIPMGAGLGGGSSDASSMLVMLNGMYALGLDSQQLCDRAVRLGADCPSFIHNRPMLASGIGDMLTPINVDIRRYRMVLVKPDIHISTTEAYAGCKPCAWTTPLSEIVSRPIETWRDTLVNDFERTVFAKHPKLGIIKDIMYNEGAVYAAMSGSGSTIYGLFANQPDSRSLDEKIKTNLNGIAHMSYYLQ